MTYIEFFDQVAAANVISCLSYAPDRVIYIGQNAKLIDQQVKHYERVFRDRGYDIQFESKSVSRTNLEDAVAMLTKIVEADEPCVFDVTGGEEVLLVALGMVYATHPDRDIQIHRFNIRNNTIYDYDRDGKTVYQDVPTLSVQENIRIYGGDVIFGGVQEKKTYRWDFNREFLTDFQKLWDVCSTTSWKWNAQLGIFSAAEEVGTVSEDGLTTTAPWGALEQQLAKNDLKYKIFPEVLRPLLENGFIADIEDTEEVRITYKNPQIKRCLVTAGQVLELRVFLVAAAQESKGEPVYDDALTGVVIDWDGEQKGYDTENEIDVLLMHDTVPVFISCKNGKFTADELYKLETVAERFGGEYAKKVLVTTALDSMEDTAEYIRRRAKDMKIALLENVHLMDDKALGAELINRWKN